MHPFEKYLHIFSSLNRNKSQAKGAAPHKPILLLSLLEMMELYPNHGGVFEFSEEMEGIFSNLWEQFAIATTYTRGMTNPIFHLQSDGGFWQVRDANGKQLERGYAPSTLRKKGYRGRLGRTLTELLQDQENRNLARMVIVDSYFPDVPKGSQYPSIEVREPSPRYRGRMTWQEGFVRNWRFSGEVKKAYDYTCCMSNYQISPIGAVNHSLLEAAHIEEHHSRGDDSINNGIPLLINLHRAFDAGFLGISDDYTIIVNHKRFKENDHNRYALTPLHGEQIRLPKNPVFYPSLEKLEAHRKGWGM